MHATFKMKSECVTVSQTYFKKSKYAGRSVEKALKDAIPVLRNVLSKFQTLTEGKTKTQRFGVSQ